MNVLLVGDPRQSHIAKIFPKEIALNLVNAAKAEINREEAIDAAILAAKLKCPELFRPKALLSAEERYEALHGKPKTINKTAASQESIDQIKSSAKRNDEAILKTIVMLGYNPEALPSIKNGQKGVRSKVCKELGPRIPRGLFDCAWRRLADKKKIAYGKEQ